MQDDREVFYSPKTAHPDTDRNEHEQMTTLSTPEFLLAPPSSELSVARVYPIRGEWSNGNLVSLLKDLFSQQISGQAEVVFVVNMGSALHSLYQKDETGFRNLKDKHDNFVLKSMTDQKKQEPGTPEYIWAETQSSLAFLKVLYQLQQATNPEFVAGRLKEFYPDQSDLLDLVVRNRNIKLSIVDATRWEVPQEYSGKKSESPPMATMRTLGVDVLDIRYGETNSDIPVMFGDVDTDDDGNAMKKVSELFADNELLEQCALPLSYIPGFDDQLQFVVSPAKSLSRAVIYASPSHGSPQIVARLRDLQKLEEIGDYNSQISFQGDEDKDTADRLAFYFGEMSQMVAFEHGLTIELPIVFTTHRTSGFTDGRIDTEELAVQHMGFDMDQSDPNYWDER